MSPDTRDALLGSVVLAAIFAYAIWQFHRSGKSWRDLARGVGHLILQTLFVMAVIGAMLYVAFRYFKGWDIAWVLLGEVVVLVLAMYVAHWLRYPGVFESKSSWKLTGEVLLTIALIAALPVLAPFLAVYGHISFLLPKRKSDEGNELAVRLGLGFRHGKGDWVQFDVKGLGAVMAKVRRVRVVRADEVSRGPGYPMGTVVYEAEAATGEVFEFVERAKA